MMADIKRKVPNLRFKGFTDDWEQRKLGEITSFINGRAYKQSELLEKGRYPVLRVGNFYTNDDWYYSNLELPAEKYANKGDLLYTWSATFGPHIWDGNKVVYHYHIWKVNTSRDITKSFLYQFLIKDRNNLLNNTNGSIMIHITKKNMESKNIYLPRIDEQKIVGNFLKKLDSLISLQQRKLEQLKQLKIFTLQRMFIDKDCKQPILRFKNFKDNWLPHKFNDIANTFSGGTPAISNKDYYGGNIPFIRSAEINKNTTQLHLTPDGLKNSSAKFIKKGTLLYALYGATSGEVGIAQIDGAINQAVMAITLKKDNVYFIKTWLIKNKRKIISTYLQGGQGNLSAKIVKHLKLSLPKIEEEKLISITIMKIDSLIKLQQSKIDDLVNLKKYLLQKLFI